MTQSQTHTNDWYKNAVVYALDISRFYDVDGDGVGDIKGLINKLDYLVELGVTCIWLLPFHPSGGKDNGYDVVDYMQVDPRLGNLEDFRTLLKTARSKGLRIIMDLVIQHTSIRHPWFVAATVGKSSKYHDYYVWADSLSPEIQDINSFPTVEDGVWQYDENMRSYYRHQFYNSMPDLNIANRDVQDEIYAIMDFWLAFGIDGFRLDAASFLLQMKGVPSEDMEPKTYFENLRSFVSKRNPDAILLAEADVDFESIPDFFGDDNRFHLLYNFLLNGVIYLSLAEQDAVSLKRCLKEQAKVRRKGTWLNFIRNADELNLERLSSDDHQKTMKTFASDPRAQIYSRGIRRRLPPMLEGDSDRIAMIYSLLFALPGTPMFIYGEEIGMGDDMTLPGRNSVRLPMQWTAGKNAGFSAAEKDKLFVPINDDKYFGYKKVNVEMQRRAANSLLKTFQLLIAIRKQHHLLGRIDCKILEDGDPGILGLDYGEDGHGLVILHNFSDKRQRFTLPKAAKNYTLLAGEDLRSKKYLKPYGFSWLEY
jgi:maltose alpha-D-glucosyltransferase / alpha-amylase